MSVAESMFLASGSCGMSLVESKNKLLLQFPVGTKVKIGGEGPHSGRTGNVMRGHFDGWYVALDKKPRERTEKEVLVLQGCGLEVLS